MKPYLVIFVSVLLAEMGDKTQLATLLFATDATLSRWGVLAGAAAALLVSTVVAVAIGTWAAAWIPARHLHLTAALGFIAIGAWMLLRRWGASTGPPRAPALRAPADRGAPDYESRPSPGGRTQDGDP